MNKGKAPDEPPSITVSGVPIRWNENNRGFTSFGNDSILFWTRPSLVSILQPLHDELGDELYSRLIAFESSKGTYEDYHSIVTSMGKSFEEGFAQWCEVVKSVGWGTVSMLSIDWNEKVATVRIEDPWEMKMFASEKNQDHIPFLSGKVSGIFSHAFGTNCRSTITEVNHGNTPPNVTLKIAPSTTTLEQALIELQERRQMSEKTNLRTINATLRRSQKRMLDILETVGEFIWESDTNLRITHLTEKATTVLRRKDNDLLGKTWNEIMDPEGAPALNEMLRDLQSGKKQFAEGEFSFWTKHGEEFWILLRIKLLHDFSENLLGYVGSGQDITDQKILEQSLEKERRKSFFASKMATLGEMAGGIAHEINTPLAVIRMNAEQLSELSEESIPPDELKRYAQKIVNTVERIAKIVSGLKIFARDADGDPFTPVSLSSLVDHTLALCSSRFSENACEIRLDPIQDGIEIEGRSTQLSQVLLNLLNNSYDAISDSKERWVRISTDVTEDRVKIRVMDSGLPMPQEIRDKIMQPFFTTKPVGKGTGLGLSISRGIMEVHRGSLYLDPESTRTCFVMDLPRYRPDSRS